MANVINATSTNNGGLITTGDDSGVLNIQTNETTAATIDASQNVSFTNSVNMPNTFGFKNRIINGGMVIDQRNAGASVSSLNNYFIDRWFASYLGSGTGRFSGQQSTTAPSGFTKSMLITVTTADGSPSSNYGYGALQFIEGNNVADLAWGSASANSVTVSFWVRSSLTGTFPVAIQNSAGTRVFGATYTISSANTFEYKTIVVTGDTTGTWLTDSGIGISLVFGFGGGSGRTISTGWQTTGGLTYTNISGTTSLIGTNGATFYITGVQLEKGTQATSFDFRSFGTELALCQRYYEKSLAYGTVPANGAVSDPRAGIAAGVATGTAESNAYRFSVTKRTGPTMTYYNGSAFGVAGQWAIYSSGWIQGATTSSALYDNYFTVQISPSGFPANSAGILSGSWSASAEL